MVAIPAIPGYSPDIALMENGYSGFVWPHFSDHVTLKALIACHSRKISVRWHCWKFRSRVAVDKAVTSSVPWDPGGKPDASGGQSVVCVSERTWDNISQRNMKALLTPTYCASLGGRLTESYLILSLCRRWWPAAGRRLRRPSWWPAAGLRWV